MLAERPPGCTGRETTCTDYTSPPPFPTFSSSYSHHLSVLLLILGNITPLILVKRLDDERNSCDNDSTLSHNFLLPFRLL